MQGNRTERLPLSVLHSPLMVILTMMVVFSAGFLWMVWFLAGDLLEREDFAEFVRPAELSTTPLNFQYIVMLLCISGSCSW